MVIDDSEPAANMLRARIEHMVPDVQVDINLSPEVAEGYHIYFIDNDFHGKRHGLRLLQKVQDVAPQAMIVSFSAHLDDELLKKMVNRGCDAVLDKTSPGDFDDVLLCLQNYVSYLKHQGTPVEQMRFIGLVDSLRDLLREWNKRLEKDVA